MVHAQLLHHRRREDARRKGATENVGKLLVEATDAHLGKAKVLLEDGLAALALEAGELDARALRLTQLQVGLRIKHPALRGGLAAALAGHLEGLERPDLDEEHLAVEVDNKKLANGEILLREARHDARHERRAVHCLHAARRLLHNKVGLERRI